MTGSRPEELLQRLISIRQHQHRGRRSPHKPLLLLLLLGRIRSTGASKLPWTEAEQDLKALLTEFGPPSSAVGAQSAAYPFTRLRSDGFWELDRDVPMDSVQQLRRLDVTGCLDPAVEAALREDPELLNNAARLLVLSQFPETVAPDVLLAVGLDPDEVISAGPRAPGVPRRRRNPAWRDAVLQAWDRQCAFCGFDGQVGSATAGIDAAHVRWFAFDGPDALDNGLALCVLHHKMFDLGVLGLDTDLRIQVSTLFSARTDAGRAIYDLHDRALRPRPGTVVPGQAHIDWHRGEVFKGAPLRV